MKTALFFFTVLMVQPLFADLNEVDTEALRKTQDMLVDKGQRNEALQKDANALKMDQDLSHVSDDPAHKEAMYGIAASVMKNITEKAKGDDIEMQKMLQDAQANPEAFYQKMLSGDQQNKIRDLANEIEKSKEPKNPGPTK